MHTYIKLLRDIHTTIRTKLHTYMQKYFYTYKHSKMKSYIKVWIQTYIVLYIRRMQINYLTYINFTSCLHAFKPATNYTKILLLPMQRFWLNISADLYNRTQFKHTNQLIFTSHFQDEYIHTFRQKESGIRDWHSYVFTYNHINVPFILIYENA